MNYNGGSVEGRCDSTSLPIQSEHDIGEKSSGGGGIRTRGFGGRSRKTSEILGCELWLHEQKG